MMNRRSTRRENGSRARPPVTSTFLLQKEGRVTLALYSIADATSARCAMLLFLNILERKSQRLRRWLSQNDTELMDTCVKS
jgi:hypothetical protein